MTAADRLVKAQRREPAMDDSSGGLPYCISRSLASQQDLMDEARFEKGCRLLMLVARTRYAYHYRYRY